MKRTTVSIIITVAVFVVLSMDVFGERKAVDGLQKAIVQPSFGPSKLFESRYFECKLPFVLTFGVIDKESGEKVHVYDCGGDGAIDYAKTGADNTNDPKGWLEQESLSKYGVYVAEVNEGVRARLKKYLSNVENISFKRAEGDQSFIGYSDEDMLCQTYTMYFGFDGEPMNLWMMCIPKRDGTCKMWNFALEDVKSQPVAFGVWNDLWEAAPDNYPSDAVMLANSLIEKIPEVTTAPCGIRTTNVKFVR